MNTPNRQRSQIKSVALAGKILHHLSAAGSPIALKEVAALTGIPASKAHRYLSTLIDSGLVRQHGHSGQYDLGPEILALGAEALGRLDVMRLAEETLSALVSETGHTVFIATWGNRGATIVRWQPAPAAVTLNARPGSVLPTQLSSTGLVFQAFQQPHLLEPVLDAESDAAGDVPHQSCDIKEIRKRGLARVAGTYQPGIHAMSGPVFDHLGKITAVLTVLGSEGQFDGRWSGPVATALKAQTTALSRRLGWRPST